MSRWLAVPNFKFVGQIVTVINVSTRQKKKLLAFSFANFKTTRWNTGMQWGSLEYPTNLVMNSGLQGKCTTILS